MGADQSAPQNGTDQRRHPVAAPHKVESDSARAAREARAAAFENKLAPKKGRDREQVKAENWRKYDAIGKEKSAVVAAVPAPWVPPESGGHVLGSATVNR